MKRTYTKPELFCEEYELSVSIAANCAKLLNKANASFNNADTCAFRIGVRSYFANMEYCTAKIEDGGILMGELVCYHQPAEDSIVFTS